MKGGPGRKPRACSECKRQKMKCDVSNGSRKCKHCLRRNVECSLLFVQPTLSHGLDESLNPKTPSAIERYEQKIDALHHEIGEMRGNLEALVQGGARLAVSSSKSKQNGDGMEDVSFTPHSHGVQKLPSNVSAREDNMQMAMTRENSMEPEETQDIETTQQGAVTVDEPMSSLYEVTRLRNIRSNQARTVRPLVHNTANVNDFITRGVLSEAEAQELYDT